MDSDNKKIFMFDLGQAVKVKDIGIVGVIDLCGLQRSFQYPRYLIEWVNNDGSVHESWYGEDRLEKVTK